MLAVVLTLGAMPVYGTFASAGTDKPAVETTDETPAPSTETVSPEPATTPAPSEAAIPMPSVEQEATTTPSGEVIPSQEPKASPTPGAEPAESPEPENTTYANSISGMLWLDMYDDIDNRIYAGDGVQQSEEQPIKGYTVKLFKADDLETEVQTITTNVDGMYIFENIEPGSYVMGVKTETVDGIEYLLPFYYLDGTEGDNRFAAAQEDPNDGNSPYTYAYTAPIEVEADTVVTDMNAGMRTVPGVKPMATVTVTGSLTGSYTSLTDAMNAVHYHAASGGTYTVTLSGNETISSTLNLHTYGTNKNVTVTSGGSNNFTITQTAADQRHFWITSMTTLTLQNVTLDGNDTGGGVIMYDSSTLNINSTTIRNCRNTGFGGAVNVGLLSTVIMNEGTISNNTAGSSTSAALGGGVYMSNYSTFRMNSGTISGNKVLQGNVTGVFGDGSAVYMTAGSSFVMESGIISGNTNANIAVRLSNDTSGSVVPEFTMNGGTITGNSGTGIGGSSSRIILNAGTISNNTGGGVSSFRSYNTTALATLEIYSGVTITGNTKIDTGGGVSVDRSNLIIEGATITNNSSGGFGGGLYLTFEGGVTVSIQDVRITGNTSDASGGGMYLFTLSSFVPISGCTIEGNAAAEAGGGIFIQSATAEITITDTIISNNTATNSGGGIHSRSTHSVNISNSTISDNGAQTIVNGTTYGPTAYAGGIRLTASYSGATGAMSMTLNDCDVSNNTATGDGGGIVVSGGASMELNDAAIYQNTVSTGNGGGICIAQGTVFMNDGIVVENKAANGGGIYLGANSSFALYGGSISNNTATGNGGGCATGAGDSASIYLYGGSVNENAARNGGGIFMSGTSMLTLDGGTIEKNAASASGGGIYSDSTSRHYFMSGSVSNNTASIYGGGLYLHHRASVACSIGDVEINDNGHPMILNSTNYGPTTSGGGICFGAGGTTNNTLNLGETTISGNMATGNGGGVAYNATSYAYNNRLVLDNGAVISGNTANNGGGIYSSCAFITVTDGSIEGNAASVSGGGIYAFGGAGNASTLFINNNGTVSGNTAGTYGGGIYTEGNELVEVSGAVNNNGNQKTINGTSYGPVNSGGGIYGGYYVYMRSSGASISGNTASYRGGGVYTQYADTNAFYATEGTISNNTAVTGAGGGIFTFNTKYIYLNIWSDVVFSGNRASSATIYTGTPSYSSYIRTTSASITFPTGSSTYTTHPLNNYDINYTGASLTYTVYVDYEDNSGGAVTGKTNYQISGITPLASYTPTAAETAPPSGYVLIDWKLSGVSQGNTSPTIASVTGNMTITLVYAREIGSIKIEKYDHAGTAPLTGAEFKLEKLVASGGAVDTTFTAQTMTTGAGGSVTFANLSVGIYIITETKAPAGYDLLTKSFEVTVPYDITLTAGQTPTYTNYLYSTTSGGNVTYHYYDVTYKVSDQASIAMPSAGVMRALPPYALWGGGIILLAALGGGFLWLKRRKAYEPKHG